MAQSVELLDSLLTVEQAAEALKVKPGGIRKFLHQGRLQRVKVGRLTRLRKSDVDRIVQNGLPPLAAVIEAAL